MIFLYCALIFSSVWFGVCLSKRFALKQKFYEDMLNFLLSFKTNLYFKQENFKELISSQNEDGDFKKFILSTFNEQLYKPEYLSIKEIKQAEDIVIKLGGSGLSSAEETVVFAENLIKTRLDQATKVKQKYSGVSIKISLLVGLLLVVLLL